MLIPPEADKLGFDPEPDGFMIFGFGDGFVLGLFVDRFRHELVDKNILNLIY